MCEKPESSHEVDALREFLDSQEAHMIESLPMKPHEQITRRQSSHNYMQEQMR